MADTTNPAEDSGHDLLKEDCMSFAKAARKLPKVRGDKTPAPSTLYRWAKKGRRSESGQIVHLEYLRVGGTNCTSMEALARFFARLRDDDPPARSCTSARPSPMDKTDAAKHNSPQKRANEATEILRRRGIVK